MSFSFESYGVGAESMCTLADLLCRDIFPALRKLCFSGNPDITDVGVVALAIALQETTQTYLMFLNLDDVGMGDGGIAALASLVAQGRLEQIAWLKFSGNNKLIDQGVITLAQAIEARGLPILRVFTMRMIFKLRAVGITAIAQALTKGCPRLVSYKLTDFDPEEEDGL